jgi:hypothetical protein
MSRGASSSVLPKCLFPVVPGLVGQQVLGEPVRGLLGEQRFEVLGRHLGMLGYTASQALRLIDADIELRAEPLKQIDGLLVVFLSNDAVGRDIRPDAIQHQHSLKRCVVLEACALTK